MVGYVLGVQEGGWVAGRIAPGLAPVRLFWRPCGGVRCASGEPQGGLRVVGGLGERTAIWGQRGGGLLLQVGSAGEWWLPSRVYGVRAAFEVVRCGCAERSFTARRYRGLRDRKSVV